MPARLLRDYHPVDVIADDEVVAVNARAFVTTEAIEVYCADEQRNVVHVASLPIDRAAAPRGDRGTLRGARLDVQLADERTCWLNAGRGCGCGSPLKVMERPASW